MNLCQCKEVSRRYVGRRVYSRTCPKQAAMGQGNTGGRKHRLACTILPRGSAAKVYAKTNHEKIMITI